MLVVCHSLVDVRCLLLFWCSLFGVRSRRCALCVAGRCVLFVGGVLCLVVAMRCCSLVTVRCSLHAVRCLAFVAGCGLAAGCKLFIV